MHYLHEVVRPLHLGHEVLHRLLPDHWVIGRGGRGMVHSNIWICSQLDRGLVLEGIHHLFNTQTHVTGAHTYNTLRNMHGGIKERFGGVEEHT